MIETESIALMAKDAALVKDANKLLNRLCEYKYSYHFDWMGRPIIQFPQDMVAMQELIWDIKPDLIIETGIAHGGSLIFSASMLAQLDMYEAIAQASMRTSFSKSVTLRLDIPACWSVWTATIRMRTFWPNFRPMRHSPPKGAIAWCSTQWLKTCQKKCSQTDHGAPATTQKPRYGNTSSTTPASKLTSRFRTSCSSRLRRLDTFVLFDLGFTG